VSDARRRDFPKGISRRFFFFATREKLFFEKKPQLRFFKQNKKEGMFLNV